MHDPASLDAILSAVFYGVIFWIVSAVGGAFYLGVKWLPTRRPDRGSGG